MQRLYEMIGKAGPEEISRLVKAVPDRYRELYPQWEVSLISIDRTDNRTEQIDRIIAVLETMKHPG